MGHHRRAVHAIALTFIAAATFFECEPAFGANAAPTNTAPTSASSTNACQALNPNADDVRPCPPSGGAATQMIADNLYPAMAVSVTDQFGRDFAVGFVLRALEAEPDRPPQFLIHSRPLQGTMGRIRDEIKKRTQGNPERQRKWLAALSEVGGPAQIWQQDLYQSVVDTSTGRPIMRESTDARRAEGRIASIANYALGSPFENISGVARAECGIQAGPPIAPPPAPSGHVRDEYAGGNLEATHGGLCLLGGGNLDDRSWRALAKEVCGDPQRALKVPTFFAATLHADEVVTTVRAPNRQAPCDFAILVASPEAALQEMAKNRDARFMSYPDQGDSENLRRFRSEELPYRALCRSLLAHRRENPRRGPDEGPAGRTRTVGWIEIGLPVALATGSFPTGARVEDCLRITNGDVLDFLNSSATTLGQVNRSIQNHMSDFKQKLAARVSEMSPRCNPEIVDVPNLFTGRMTQSVNGRPVVAANSSRSLFPNPTNGVQFGSTYIGPEPGNAAVRDSFKSKLEALGVRFEGMDTTTVNEYYGNVHCATNVMRYCRPGVEQASAAPASSAPPQPVPRANPSASQQPTRRSGGSATRQESGRPGATRAPQRQPQRQTQPQQRTQPRR